MAKKKPTHTLALRFGHATLFRRTVTLGNGEKIQMVFEPDRDYEVTDEELAGGLQKLVDDGLLVDPNRDPKGRRRPLAAPTADATAAIDKLEKRVEDLAAENAQLKADLEAATAPK